MSANKYRIADIKIPISSTSYDSVPPCNLKSKRHKRKLDKLTTSDCENTSPGIIKSSKRNLGNSKGFSLLELITALAIVVILLTTSHLSVKGLKSSDLKSNTSDLARYIETLSLISAKYNSDIEVAFSENQAIAQPRECNNCPKFTRQTLSKGITFSDVKFGNLETSSNKLILWKSGSVSPGHIKLKNISNSECSLTISQTGLKTLSCNI